MRTSCYAILIAFVFSGSLRAQIEQVTDINPDGDSKITEPYMFNGILYFGADANDDAGNELYTMETDGSVLLFKDINVDPDDGSPDSYPSNFFEYKGKLYFTANDGDNTGHGVELWVTDGTSENTQMVYDIWSEIKKGSDPAFLFIFNDTMYFRADDGSSTEWWKYNGDSIPKKITNLRPDDKADVSFPVVDEDNGRVFFQYRNENNKKGLCVLNQDGSTSVILSDDKDDLYNGEEAILLDGNLYFQGKEADTGRELWVSDGTPEGTRMIKDIKPGGGNSDPMEFIVFNGKVCFIVNDPDGVRLWETDGTTEGTKIAADPRPGKDTKMEGLIVYNNELFFSAEGENDGVELWKYDGSSTSMVMDIHLGDKDSKPKNFAIANGLLLFTAKDEFGETLWVTDGTEENTKHVASMFGISEDPTKFSQISFFSDGTSLYFVAEDDKGDDIFKINAETINLGTPVLLKKQNEAKVLLYPNPCNGVVSISGGNGSSEYFLFNVNGQLISSGRIDHTLRIEQGSGIFYLQLINDGSTTIHKVVVN